MKFQVFKDGSAVDDFKLCGAYMFGTDGIGIRRSQIRFKNGLVECEKPNLETAGLALLWPVAGFGRALLPTTCLPERARPYNLNVEMARAKLMQIINKREDWSIFNNIEDLGGVAKEAQGLFIQAVQNLRDAPLAAKLADESLRKSITFSEDLAAKQAEALFEVRGKSHGFGRGCLGCRIDPAQIRNPQYVEQLVELFGFATIPINWAEIESRKGNYDFAVVDACMEVLSKKKLAIGAGPVLRFSRGYLPKWLVRSRMEFEKIRETAYQFASRLVTRYSDSICAWVVLSGLNVLNHFGFGFEQILEMTHAANIAVRQACERGLRIIEISNPWGEYYATMPNTLPPLVYIDMVVQSGVTFDAFGLQMQFGKNLSGMHVRDMMQISAILDCFASIGKPLYVADVSVPSQNAGGLQEPRVAGVWRDEWDEPRQAEWIEQFYRIALSKPFVDSVTYSSLCDVADSTIAHSGLLTEQLEPKQSYRRLRELHDRIFNR